MQYGKKKNRRLFQIGMTHTIIKILSPNYFIRNVLCPGCANIKRHREYSLLYQLFGHLVYDLVTLI